MIDSLKKTGKLPDNFISKTEAYELGWKPGKTVPNGKTIGAEPYLNDEKLLPSAPNRNWHEADINYKSGGRGEERLLYSNDGLLYFTRDHGKNFVPMGKWK